MRVSTVQRISRSLFLRMIAYMRKASCGFIVRIAGDEIGIVSISNGMLVSDDGKLFPVSRNVYIRKGF